ncbi:ABC transporter ATP-binding protein [Tabrizicola oligotrophica]|uniref:ABC transporter ATP-binding protein n=1 Tax=Tabrizicola oligotrophica TaxID=2710650 RepID=A0A6M0QWK3_9RHOB|nr:ABC transporter ATP-binding protein [Tabrizicola oligotrophica]NEY91810.1 ABC transporter ATP-binding protein [Tabrizicola oligotrophica]
MSAIHLQGLVKRFGQFTALKTMDLAIADGEFMALLGPSGCGKSTTMNMIAGMERPSEGRILFGNQDVTGLPMGRRGVGFVFQNYAIFTHMTVRQNLSYGLRMMGRPASEVASRTGTMAEMLGLTALLDRPAAGLSVNILQRLAIGRSAVMEPAIFLLDEPLSNVDAAFRAVMRTELKSLQRQFRQTMVYVTHDQLEAMTMADRIAVMDHGVLQQVGTPLEVYNDPVNTFVARFIGAPGMNLLPGRLLQHAGGLCVDLGPLGISAPLPGPLAAAAASAPAEVIYGFRPEEVQLDPAAPLGLPLTVTERIGARSILHLGEGETSVRAVFQSGEPLPEAGLVRFQPAAAAVRLFDAATGRAIRGV